jgi:quercetin dioxygenase-like cupin family protein
MLQLSDREKIDQLALVMATMPQAPAMPTEHFFAGGMYCRRIHIPQGTAIVSKTHKTEHFFIGCIGQMIVHGEGEPYLLHPGVVIKSPIGTRRAVYAVTDVVCMTIHKTDKTSTDGLEDEMVEIDENSKYDVNNNPKPGVLVAQPREVLQ